MLVAGIRPPYDYYPLSTLMQAGLKEILVISTERERENFERLLGDGSQFGIKIEFAVQKEPRGIADAFIIGEEFIDGDDVMLILGDNIFHAWDMERVLEEAIAENEGATIFGQTVKDPERFGVIGYDENFNVISLEEKPSSPNRIRWQSDCTSTTERFPNTPANLNPRQGANWK